MIITALKPETTARRVKPQSPDDHFLITDIFYSKMAVESIRVNAMRVKVTLWVSGKTFDEVVTVASYEDAKKTALARNPTAKVVAINAVFD